MDSLLMPIAKEYVVKNYLAYVARMDKQLDYSLNRNKYLTDGYNNNLFEYFPKLNEELIIDIESVDILFPKKGLRFYRLKIESNKFYNHKEQVTRLKVSSDSKSRPDESFLVAIDTLTRNVLFLSGKYYVTDYWRYYNESYTDKAQAVRDYLTIRLNQYSLDSLRLDKKLWNKYKFTAFSKYFNENIIITAGKYDPYKLIIVVKEK